MKTTWLVTASMILFACGGSDAGIPDATSGGDGGGDTGVTTDSGGGTDTGGGNDTGTNDGAGNDGSANDSGGGGDGGNFNVGNVSCLVLWLDAAKGVTQNNTFVSAWADQSGKNNNATQGSGSRQPSVANNVINNLPALHFNSGQTNGNMMLIADSASMQWGTGDFAVWTVARFNNNPNGGLATGIGLFYSKAPFNQVNANGPWLYGNYSGAQQTIAGLQGGVSLNNTLNQMTAYNDNMPRAYTFRRAGTTLELRVGGQVVQTMMQNGSVDVSDPNVSARIGADGDASIRRLNGDIAEVIGCKGAISNQDLAGVDAYLKSKYNL
jgi:hypothetical protein